MTSRDRRADLSPPPASEVLGALDDETCRCILDETADEPLSASEIAEACGVSSSTAYRKIRLLASAGLLAESTRVRADGNHANQYERSFAAVVVYPTNDGLEVSVLAEGWIDSRERSGDPLVRTPPTELSASNDR